MPEKIHHLPFFFFFCARGNQIVCSYVHPWPFFPTSVIFRKFALVIYLKYCFLDLEIKRNNIIVSFVPFLDIYLKYDTNGQLTTRLLNKRNYFYFVIINVPQLDSNIPTAPGYGIYISQLIHSNLDFAFRILITSSSSDY